MDTASEILIDSIFELLDVNLHNLIIRTDFQDSLVCVLTNNFSVTSKKVFTFLVVDSAANSLACTVTFDQSVYFTIGWSAIPPRLLVDHSVISMIPE